MVTVIFRLGFCGLGGGCDVSLVRGGEEDHVAAAGNNYHRGAWLFIASEAFGTARLRESLSLSR
jgi:hypothetical protein